MAASGIDWEDAFVNVDHIPGGYDFPRHWEDRAADFRSTARAELDISYGSDARETLDIFLPEGQPKGLSVFVHGGFWLAFGKSHWSHLAKGAIERGWAMTVLQYTLAPEARLTQMVRQVAAAIQCAALRINGPIHLAGHSAGGHLVTRMVCTDAPLSGDAAERVDRVVSISGLHDLRPLRLHSMNKTLGIDANEALAESPYLLKPRTDVHVTAWVGADERPEFVRQSALLCESWRRSGGQIQLVTDPDRHHFEVIDGLEDPHHPLSQTLLAD